MSQLFSVPKYVYLLVSIWSLKQQAWYLSNWLRFPVADRGMIGFGKP